MRGRKFLLKIKGIKPRQPDIEDEARGRFGSPGRQEFRNGGRNLHVQSDGMKEHAQRIPRFQVVIDNQDLRPRAGGRHQFPVWVGER